MSTIVDALAASSMVARSSPSTSGAQPVAHLGVAPDHAEGVGELGPRVRILVRAASTTEQPDRVRPTGVESLAHERGRDRERTAPGRLDEPGLAAHQRGREALVGVDRLEVEPAAVAEPSPVDRVGVDTLVAKDLVAARLDHHTTADRARRARALDLLEIPRSCLEPVRRGGERADRADLHGVAGEVRRERLVRERQHLGVVAAVDEVDQLVAGDLVGEARAAVAQDAALAVEQHQVADRDRLVEVALLLEVAALAGPVAERLVLQRTLAALVADRTVEGVVGEEQLEHAFLRPLDAVGRGVDDLSLGDRGHARHDQHRTARPLDLDEALPAHPDGCEPAVVAEPRHVGTGVVARLDHELPWRRLVWDTVDVHCDGGLGWRLRLRSRLVRHVSRRLLVRHRRPPPFRGSGGGAHRRSGGRARCSARTRAGSGAPPTRSGSRPRGRAGRSSSGVAARRCRG